MSSSSYVIVWGNLKYQALYTLHFLQTESLIQAADNSDEPDCQCPSAAQDLNNCTSGSSESWMVLSIAGDKPTPRFNVKCLLQIVFIRVFFLSMYIHMCTSLSWTTWIFSSLVEQHAAAVVGNKMVVVGGESTNGMLDDVQVMLF